MTKHLSYKELKNHMHNELEITKEDIRDLVKEAVKNEAKWLSQRLITPELINVSTQEVIRQMVREEIFKASKSSDQFPFNMTPPTLLGMVKKEITDQTKERLDIRIFDRQKSRIYASVISAFPGTGKSHAYRELRRSDLKVLDSDSSKFSWTTDEQGKKIRNPEFPKNYIDYIKRNLLVADYIFVSSHEEVRKALHDAGIDYTVVTPSVLAKDTFIERYKDRNNDQAFIDLLTNKWEEFVESTVNDKNAKSVIIADHMFVLDIVNQNEDVKVHGFL